MDALRHRHPVVVIALAACLLAGCATRMSEQDLRASLDAIKPVPARRAIRRVVPIYASTPMEAWVLRAEAKGSPESSPLSLELADGFEIGQIRQIDYIVGGPHSGLSEQIVLNGLKMTQGKALPGLRILFVSPDAPTDDLLRAAKARRVRLEHRALP